jgi:hypothetical protein
LPGRKTGARSSRKPEKRPRKVLAWFLVFLLVTLFGVSLGFAAVSFNIAEDGTLSPALQAVQDMSGSLGPFLSDLIEKLHSETIPKWMPTIQVLLTTTATTLGIIATIKTLRRK